MIGPLGAMGYMIGEIALGGAGMVFAILALVIGLMKNTTGNQDDWPIIFTTLSWTIAMIIPNIVYTGIIFAAGALTLTMAFTPMLNKARQPSIILMGIIIIVINAMLIIGSGLFSIAVGWQTTYSYAKSDTMTILRVQAANIGNETPQTGLCKPNAQNVNNRTCESVASTNKFNPLSYVPFATVLSIATYVAKAIVFIGATATAPVTYSLIMNNAGYSINPIMTLLIGIYIWIWQMIIFYKLVKWMFNPGFMT